MKYAPGNACEDVLLGLALLLDAYIVYKGHESISRVHRRSKIRRIVSILIVLHLTIEHPRDPIALAGSKVAVLFDQHKAKRAHVYLAPGRDRRRRFRPGGWRPRL